MANEDRTSLSAAVTTSIKTPENQSEEIRCLKQQLDDKGVIIKYLEGKVKNLEEIIAKGNGRGTS